jgi:hypothetical protein
VNADVATIATRESAVNRRKQFIWNLLFDFKHGPIVHPSHPFAT